MWCVFLLFFFFERSGCLAQLAAVVVDDDRVNFIRSRIHFSKEDKTPLFDSVPSYVHLCV